MVLGRPGVARCTARVLRGRRADYHFLIAIARHDQVIAVPDGLRRKRSALVAGGIGWPGLVRIAARRRAALISRGSVDLPALAGIKRTGQLRDLDLPVGQTESTRLL